MWGEMKEINTGGQTEWNEPFTVERSFSSFFFFFLKQKNEKKKNNRKNRLADWSIELVSFIATSPTLTSRSLLFHDADARFPDRSTFFLIECHESCDQESKVIAMLN